VYCACPSTNNACNRFCQKPEGTCLSNGNCLCGVGYTGPNAVAHNSTHVEASHCMKTCSPINPHEVCLYVCDARCKFPFGTCIESGKFINFRSNTDYIIETNNVLIGQILCNTCIMN